MLEYVPSHNQINDLREHVKQWSTAINRLHSNPLVLLGSTQKQLSLRNSDIDKLAENKKNQALISLLKPDPKKIYIINIRGIFNLSFAKMNTRPLISKSMLKPRALSARSLIKKLL